MSVFLPPRKFTAPEFVLGTGSHSLLSAYLSRFASRRILLASDKGLEAIGLPERIHKALGNAGFAVFPYSDISPNPREREVRNGTAHYLENGCDAIVALGGGSVMDAAKGIGLMASNGCDVLCFEGVDAIPLPGPPLVCLPTTAGTAADISQFAIINDTTRKTKIAIVSKKTIPDISLIDPELSRTMDPLLTAATGMDALTHAIEACVSRGASAVSEVHALKAIELAGEHLIPAVENGTNREARNGMAAASLFAGLAFSNAGLGAVHALAHPLGGQLDLPHGLCNALLLETVCLWNFDSARTGYRAIMRAFARGLLRIPQKISAKLCSRCKMLVEDACHDVIEKSQTGKEELAELLGEVRRALPLPAGLAEAGLKREDIPSLARKAWLDACLATNPRAPQTQDLETLYAAAL